jgi:chromosome partitioning protein
MIITVGGIKGGSGKTTVATNLVVTRSTEGRDVLLVDGDDQETSSDFTAVRGERRAEEGAGYTCIKLSNAAVRTEVLKLKDKFSDIVVDTGGRDTTSQRAALSVSDVLLVPFVPRSFDVWTLEQTSSLVEEVRVINPNIRAYMFLSKADSRGNENEEAREYLSRSPHLTFLDTPLVLRKAYSDAAGKGEGVVEYRPKDDKAITEFRRLYDIVFAINNIHI